MPKIGVLAVQGAFNEHINAFKRCLTDGNNIDIVEVRCADDITNDMIGIVLPGGMLKCTQNFLKNCIYENLLF